jgi:hypothetical protein
MTLISISMRTWQEDLLEPMIWMRHCFEEDFQEQLRSALEGALLVRRLDYHRTDSVNGQVNSLMYESP